MSRWSFFPLLKTWAGNTCATTRPFNNKNNNKKSRRQIAESARCKNQRTFLSLRQNCVIVISRAFFSFHGVTNAFTLSFLPASLPKFRPRFKLSMYKTWQNLPMQFRGPAEKGTNAYGWRPWLFSGRKRSGLNSSGASHTFGFLWSPIVQTPRAVPFGAK